MIVVTCRPFFFSTSLFSVMCWLCRHHTSYCKRWHLLSCHAVHIPTEYMWWFAKAVLLSDAFHGLSVVFWWLGFSWSILVLAICSYVPKFIVESTSWTLHFDTLWMLLLSINLCVRVCSNHIRDEIDPLFFAITIFSFLHPVPWVPRGEKRWMRTIIVTPAKAKSGIFNLLWLGLGAQFRYLYGAN